MSVPDSFTQAESPSALPEDSRAVRFVGPVFLVCALLQVPWTIMLAFTLPSREQALHYDVAWTGFDLLLLVGVAATAVLTMRRSRYLSIAASATAAMLVTDAWFDTVTAPDRGQLEQALVLMLLVELPLAVVCLWLAVHTTDLTDRRLRLVLRRTR